MGTERQNTDTQGTTGGGQEHDIFNSQERDAGGYQKGCMSEWEDGWLDKLIYTDEKKHSHKVYNLCPHLKCGLLFNEVEHTWDCPCHGSRFDIDGYVIEGPSNYNITYNE